MLYPMHYNSIALYLICSLIVFEKPVRVSYMSESMFCKQISKIVCSLINYYQTNILYVNGMFVDDTLL